MLVRAATNNIAIDLLSAALIVVADLVDEIPTGVEPRVPRGFDTHHNLPC